MLGILITSNIAIHLSRRRMATSVAENNLRPGDGERSKDVPSLMGASGSPPRDSSQEATVGVWLKSAKQSGSSDGLRVSVI